MSPAPVRPSTVRRTTESSLTRPAGRFDAPVFYGFDARTIFRRRAALWAFVARGALALGHARARMASHQPERLAPFWRTPNCYAHRHHVMPSSVAPLPALPPRPPPVVTSPAPESTRPVAGQSAVMGMPVPICTDSNASTTGAEDATQQQRRGGRHTKVHIAPEPQRPTDQPKRSRRSWFGLGQTEKEVAALQGWLAGMSATECRQVDSAARYLQLRCRRVVKTPRLVAACASIYRSRGPTAWPRAASWA